MAKPLQEITKNDFKHNYNVVKVLTDKIAIMKQLETFNAKTDVVAFAKKKQPNDAKPPKWFENFVDNEFKPFKQLVIEQFKQHNWIK